MCLLTKTLQTGSLRTYPTRDLSPHSQSPAAGMINPDQASERTFTRGTWDSGICSSVAPTMQLVWIVCITSSI